jgi:hypothetical protein
MGLAQRLCAQQLHDRTTEPSAARLPQWMARLIVGAGEDATSEINVDQDPRFGCGRLRSVRFGKPLKTRAAGVQRAPRRIGALLL